MAGPALRRRAEGLRTVRDASLRVFAPWVIGDVRMRLVEQQGPLWLRIVAANPSQSPGL